jgi:hypothetical protein
LGASRLAGARTVLRALWTTVWSMMWSALVASRALALGALHRLGAISRRGAGPQRQTHFARLRWAVVGLLGVAAIGGGAAGISYLTPPLVAAGFCGSLRAHDYNAAYAQLARGVRVRYSPAVFAQAARSLEDGEGAIGSCVANPLPGAYTLNASGADTAVVPVTLSRARSGSLSGVVPFRQENGAWRVAGLPASLLGIPLDAVVAANSYCAALQSGAYSQSYALWSDDAQSERSLADFTQQAQYAEQIDGAIASCGLAAVERDGTAQVAHVRLKVMRQRTGEHEGEVWIAQRDGAWRIVPADAGVPGSDLGPLLAGLRFCADLEQDDFTDAYALFADTYQQRITPGQFADDFRPDAGAQWAGCVPDLTRYSVAADQASFPLALTALFAGGARQTETAMATFVRQQTVWRIAEIGFG